MSTGASSRGRGWVVIQSTLLLALVVTGPCGRDAARVWMDGYGPVLGSVLFAIGAALGLAGVRHLGRNRTPYVEPLADAALVTTGMYAVVRHPLYASLIYAGFGWALIWNSMAALFVAAVNIAFFDAKARREEYWLRQRFPGYAAYSLRVKRFLPGIY